MTVVLYPSAPVNSIENPRKEGKRERQDDFPAFPPFPPLSRSFRRMLSSAGQKGESSICPTVIRRGSLRFSFCGFPSGMAAWKRVGWTARAGEVCVTSGKSFPAVTGMPSSSRHSRMRAASLVPRTPPCRPKAPGPCCQAAGRPEAGPRQISAATTSRAFGITPFFPGGNAGEICEAFFAAKGPSTGLFSLPSQSFPETPSPSGQGCPAPGRV